jgi:prefoldin subunit 5
MWTLKRAIMSAHDAIDFFARRLADLDTKIKACQAEIRALPRDPGRLKQLLSLLDKRNRALRHLRGFQN